MDSSEGLQALQANQNLWYRIRVLLHDLHNIATDHAAELRTLATTDELYISAPYFTAEEAALVKSTQIPVPTLTEVPEFEESDLEVASGLQQSHDVTSYTVTIEQAIKDCLQNFFEKRRASGDSRPCGPHDMGPIYRAVFGISKEELKDEKFLSHLRRSGLPRLEAEVTGKNSERKTQKAGKKEEKKGLESGIYETDKLNIHFAK
ncbi:hypothetical protein KCU65_g8372, partial [Aureobasidium melanogenum]